MAIRKPKQHTRLVYVHGTNGTGKSTLARALIAAAGGVHVENYYIQPDESKAWYTQTHQGLVLVGKYANACGGVDGLQPYANIHDVVNTHSHLGRSCFAEGLVTPGLDTCQKLASYVDEAVFVLLHFPEDVCIANVQKRRDRKGTDKTYDPANLIRKRTSAANWARRLHAAGLDVRVYSRWADAYLGCLDALALPVPDAHQLT